MNGVELGLLLATASLVGFVLGYTVNPARSHIRFRLLDIESHPSAPAAHAQSTAPENAAARIEIPVSAAPPPPPARVLTLVPRDHQPQPEGGDSKSEVRDGRQLLGPKAQGPSGGSLGETQVPLPRCDNWMKMEWGRLQCIREIDHLGGCHYSSGE